MFIRLDPSGSLREEKVADLAFFINFLNPKGLDVEMRVVPQERRVSATLSPRRERRPATRSP